MNNITTKIYEEFENNNTKIGKKIYNILDHDLCLIIASDNNIWWAEKTSMYNYIPNYFINYLKKYLKKNYNLTWLYDLKECD